MGCDKAPLSISGNITMSKSNHMRILMVAPQPFFRPRGTPFSVLHRIRALLQAGHSVDLVTYPFGEDPPLPGLKIRRCGRPPFIKDVKIGPSVAKLFLDMALYVETVRALRDGQYDILHTHEEAAFFGVGLARRYNLRHVYDMHSSLPHQLGNFKAYDFGMLRRVFRALENRVLSTCAGAITICPELAEIAVPDLDGKPHAMIENTGDDAQIFEANGADVRTEYGLKDKCVALYTGTFEPYQGLDLLLDAFAKITASRPQAHLLLVGGRPNQVESFRAAAKEASLGDAVTFTGQVHPSRIPSFIQACDFIVSPRSRGTNTPLKIYGYMRSQRALVATDMPTHTQTLDGEIARLVPPTAEGFAGGMGDLIDDPALRERLAGAAARRAEEHFSDASYLELVADFYERVEAAGRA